RRLASDGDVDARAQGLALYRRHPQQPRRPLQDPERRSRLDRPARLLGRAGREGRRMIFDPVLDIFRGKAITIPPMDGALKPNTALDDAPVALEIDAPDNLVGDAGSGGEGRLLFSSGHRLLAFDGKAVHELRTFEAEITALAISKAGDIAIGL